MKSNTGVKKVEEEHRHDFLPVAVSDCYEYLVLVCRECDYKAFNYLIKIFYE